MTRSTDQMREALSGLVRARRMLEMQLTPHGAWQALRQLIERERKGDAVAAVDAARLRGGLEQRLDRDVPFWRAWAEIDAAIARIDEAAKVPVVSPPSAEVTGAMAGQERPAAPPLFEPTVAPTPGPTPRDVIRPRIKIKAASSVVERESAPQAPPATEAPAKESPAIEPPKPASPSPTVVGAQDRPSPQKSVTPPASAATKPAGTTTSIANPADRLAALEADLDEIMGLPKASDRLRAAQPDDADDEAAGLQVEEADVLIVPIRRELLEPEAGPAIRSDPAAMPPVALSIRLKQEQHAAELDSDDYAAYLTDVGEADVEIVRFDRPANEQPAGRPVLKVISRD